MVTQRKNLIIDIFIFYTLAFSYWFIRFLLGMYTLPLMTAEGKSSRELSTLVNNNAVYEASYVKDFKGSDFLYRGEGQISISKKKIFFQGNLSPSPDYKMYLTTTFVTEV